MRVVLPPAILDALDARSHVRDDVETTEDAFLLDPGLGPAMYLTRDGRVLYDERTWGGASIREATESEAIAGLVVGARKTGVSALLALLPPCPLDGATCTSCGGDRWRGFFLCHHCGGRGWTHALR